MSFNCGSPTKQFAKTGSCLRFSLMKGPAMAIFFDRLKHQTKLFLGDQLQRSLSKRFLRGRGPASRLISVFSDQIEQIVERHILVASAPLTQSPPDYFLDGDVEIDYRKRINAGADCTDPAGIFSAENVNVSFPTSMHQIGDHILNELMLAPYVLTNPKYYYALELMRFKRKRPIYGGVLLSMPWHHNFYHWMIEILPRLISYDRCPALQKEPLIIPKSSPRFVAESLNLACYESRMILMADGTYKFKKLHMLSRLASTSEVAPDAVDWLNRKFPNGLSTLCTPRRIYVSRRDAKIRFVSNELQLADVLAEFGFETIIMSKLPLADQISAFRAADYVIGPHGAAFANLAFSKPGSTFIEFFSQGHSNVCFNRISRIRSLKYGFLVGEPTKNGGFSIDPGHLRAILLRACASV